MEAQREFAEHIFAAGAFEHEAHRKRAIALLERLIDHPSGTVPDSFPIDRERKGAYRFLENRAISPVQVAEALHESCARDCAAHALVIVPIDGSSISHTDTIGDDGVVRIGSDASGGRGLKSMIALAVSVDGVPIGIGGHVLWARPDEPNAIPHACRPLAEKESRHWTELQRAFETRLRASNAGCVPFYQMDREADAIHVLLRGLEPGVLFTVRGNKDRILEDKDPTNRSQRRRLQHALGEAPPLGAIYVSVLDSKKHRAARVARLVVRFAPVSVKLTQQWSKRHLGNAPLTAISVHEDGSCPADEQPLDWILLTSYPVSSFADASFVIRAYTLRWMIERLHYAWKTGTCHVEDSQLESFDALAKWATLHLAVAAHREHILHLSRTEPDLPADQIFDRDNIDAALTLYRAHRTDAPAPGSTPTLGTLVGIIARLGGYVGKSSGGPPGLLVFQRGMERVEAGATMLRMQREMATPTSRDRFG